MKIEKMGQMCKMIAARDIPSDLYEIIVDTETSIADESDGSGIYSVFDIYEKTKEGTSAHKYMSVLIENNIDYIWT